jgi:hypothetical protein
MKFEAVARTEGRAPVFADFGVGECLIWSQEQTTTIAPPCLWTRVGRLAAVAGRGVRVGRERRFIGVYEMSKSNKLSDMNGH